MVRRAKQCVLLLTACAALAARIASPALGGTCGEAFCHNDGGLGGCCAAAIERASPTPAGGCPRCTAVETSPCENDEQPCRCQMDSRQELPISASTGPSPRFDQAGQGVVAFAALPDVPVVAGISREDQATSRAAPIRPVRILYGVWLN